MDFTRLYQWINKYCRVSRRSPRDHNSIFRGHEGLFWYCQSQDLTASGLYHPFIPYRSNGKLKFPLCQSCAENENPDPCDCSDDQKELTGRWCTPELETALRLGYHLQKIYEVYHWEESTQYYSNIVR